MEVNIHRAKTILSRLILQAEAGEEVVIARAGKPVVKLVPVNAAKGKKFKPGAMKGRLFVSDNFLDPDPELEAMFNDRPVFPVGPRKAKGETKAKASAGRKQPKAASLAQRDSIVAKTNPSAR